MLNECGCTCNCPGNDGYEDFDNLSDSLCKFNEALVLLRGAVKIFENSDENCNVEEFKNYEATVKFLENYEVK